MAHHSICGHLCKTHFADQIWSQPRNIGMWRVGTKPRSLIHIGLCTKGRGLAGQLFKFSEQLLLQFVTKAGAHLARVNQFFALIDTNKQATKCFTGTFIFSETAD
ncbi:hypothetical protein D3C86_1541480 [compost metagenome]